MSLQELFAMTTNFCKFTNRLQFVNLTQSIQTWNQRSTKGFLTQPKIFWLQSASYCITQNVKDDKKSSTSITKTDPQSPYSGILRAGQQKFNNKLNNIYQSYEELSHTNEVRAAHQHVERLQDELKVAQQRRRDIAKQLSDMRYELQVCYADLANCKKGEPRYLELIRKEYDIHNREKTKMEEFELSDKTERDLFMHLQAAVKTSHEKEKIHTNSAKYWSIVGSLVGALLGICGTAFSFYNRNNMITSMLGEVKTEFVQLREETRLISAEIKNISSVQQKQFNEIIHLNSNKNTTTNHEESWLHWIGRYSGVIPAYRYLYPKGNSQRTDLP